MLVEKPACTHLEAVASLRVLAQQSAQPIWTAMEYRYMPPIAELVRQVHAQTATGEAVMLSIREHRYPFLEKVGDWNRFNKNTGGTLVEKCCHFFDLMRLIMKADPIRLVRDVADTLAELQRICERRGLHFKLDETLRAPAAPSSPAWQQRWERAVQALGLPLHRMPSGAGHDAMKLHDIGIRIVRNAAGEFRLTPRKSFELWSESWRGHSEPWTPAEIGVQAMLALELPERLTQKSRLEQAFDKLRHNELELIHHRDHLEDLVRQFKT